MGFKILGSIIMLHAVIVGQFVAAILKRMDRDLLSTCSERTTRSRRLRKNFAAAAGMVIGEQGIRPDGAPQILLLAMEFFSTMSDALGNNVNRARCVRW
jgi:hypothetical protein